MFVHLEQKIIFFLRYVGGLGYLAWDFFYFLIIARFTQKKERIRTGPVYFQMARVGFSSLGVVSVVLFFIGMVLALQMAYILKKFGVTEYVGSVVGVGMFREMGPLLTGLVMSGYVGAAIAAEIGTMAVSEEIEALSAGAIHPVRFLVVPRVLATSIMVPCVTMIGNFVGIFGGFLIAYFVLKISPALYLQKVTESLVIKDLWTGIFKSWVFANLIALIACYEGMRVDSGAEGVGRAATQSVVLSIVLIIFADCVFTALFYFVLEG